MISVIITAFNRREFLSMALESATSCYNTKQSIEILVCTNFDSSIKLKNFKTVKFFCFPHATSKPYLMAQGVKKSIGEIICFLDDDDIMLPHKIDKISEIFKETQDLVYIRNSVNIINSSGQSVKRKISKLGNFLYVTNDRNIPALIKHFPDTNSSSISIKREVLENYEYILEKLDASDDTFLFYCALASQKKILCLDEILSQYRVHEGGITHFSGNFKKYRQNLISKIESDLRSHQTFANIFRNQGYDLLLAVRVNYYSMILRIAYGKSDRKRAFKEAISIIKNYHILNIYPRRLFVVTESILSFFNTELSYFFMFMLSKFQRP